MSGLTGRLFLTSPQDVVYTSRRASIALTEASPNLLEHFNLKEQKLFWSKALDQFNNRSLSCSTPCLLKVTQNEKKNEKLVGKSNSTSQTPQSNGNCNLKIPSKNYLTKRRASFEPALLLQNKYIEEGILSFQSNAPQARKRSSLSIYSGNESKSGSCSTVSSLSPCPEETPKNYFFNFSHRENAHKFPKIKVSSPKGRNVAIKFMEGKLAQKSYVEEKKALTLKAHEHLVNTICVVTSKSSDKFQSCNIDWSITKEDMKLKENVSMSEAVSLFSIKTHDEIDGKKGNIHVRRNENDLIENHMKVFIIMELCTSKTLLSVINDSQKLLLIDKIRYLGEVSSGLAYLHSNHLIHLDVKPSNIFISSDGSVKLGDFGCCKHIDESFSNIIGTPIYQAPEVLKGQEIHPKSDIYSFAITMWHLLNEEIPYKDIHPHIIVYKVIKLNMRPRYKRKSNYIKTDTIAEILLERLMERCWNQNLYDRPSAFELSKILVTLYMSVSSECVE